MNATITLAKRTVNHIGSHDPMPPINHISDLTIVRVEDACGLRFWRYVATFDGCWQHIPCKYLTAHDAEFDHPAGLYEIAR